MYKFAAACLGEAIVFGAGRSGYKKNRVDRWIEFMQNEKIDRVCCLLTQAQLNRYGDLDLLEVYRNVFGNDRVCWAAIEDFQLADRDILIQQVLPFLAEANHHRQKVVVHCSGGIGRTGHILAAWLVAARGLSNQEAIAAVRRTGKNPYEAAIAAFF